LDHVGLYEVGSASDAIYAGGDEISGDDGDDLISGQQGDDVIIGGLGNDSIWSNEGEDVVYGGLPNETLTGQTDRLFVDDDDQFETGNLNDYQSNIFIGLRVNEAGITIGEIVEYFESLYKEPESELFSQSFFENAINSEEPFIIVESDTDGNAQVSIVTQNIELGLIERMSANFVYFTSQLEGLLSNLLENQSLNMDDLVFNQLDFQQLFHLLNQAKPSDTQ